MKHFKPEPPAKQKFGRWLIDQKKRDDAVGELAKAACHDPKFPFDGDVREVSARLNKLEADPDMHVALEDAELEWLAF